MKTNKLSKWLACSGRNWYYPCDLKPSHFWESQSLDWLILSFIRDHVIRCLGFHNLTACACLGDVVGQPILQKSLSPKWLLGGVTVLCGWISVLKASYQSILYMETTLFLHGVSQSEGCHPMARSHSLGPTMNDPSKIWFSGRSWNNWKKFKIHSLALKLHLSLSEENLNISLSFFKVFIGVVYLLQVLV